MRVSIKPSAIVLLVVALVFGAFPATGHAAEPVPSVPFAGLDDNLDSSAGTGEFSLGVRGRPGLEAKGQNASAEPNSDVVALDRQLDEAQVWFIIGAVLIVGITAAALSN